MRNVLLPFLLTRKRRVLTTPPPRRKNRRVRFSFALLAELYEVLSRKQFRRYVDEEDIRTFVAALKREAQWVNVNVRITACRDPQDDKFLEVAMSGHATHIVTGDSDLLARNPYSRHPDCRSAGSFEALVIEPDLESTGPKLTCLSSG